VLRMAFRRILSSTSLVSKVFGNRWRQRGKETYKLKLTNKNYKYKNRLESGTDGGKVVSLTRRPCSTPQKHLFSASGTHSC
jgi:hypothetical protein